MGIVDSAKDVVKLIQQIDNVELYKQILNLQTEIISLVEENRSLKSEILSLTDSLKTKESLKFENNAYWMKTNDGRDGPFCSKCWDKENRTVRMLSGNDPHHHECPSCQIIVNTSGSPDKPLDIRFNSGFGPRRF